jgi:hypothetical protein
VKVRNASGSSPFSNEVSSTPNAPPTTAPVVTATAGFRSVTLTWNATNLPGRIYYVIYSGPSPTLMTSYTTTSATTKVIGNLPGGVGVYWQVSARSDGGEGPLSAISALTTPSRGTVLSQNMPASESSDAFGGSAARAVDGNTSGNWAVGSVTHTGFETNPWWQVDLLGVRELNSVVVWNRADCCAERLTHFDVMTSVDGINWRTRPVDTSPAFFAEYQLG